jgi:hypothetical protein
MANPLYSQLNGASGNNPLLQRIMQFKNTFAGDPKQMVQSLINSGKVSQTQLNQYVKQANEIYKLMK